MSLVVFDMDDTLFLERTYVESGFRAVGAALEVESLYPAFFDDAWSMFEEGRRGKIFDEVLKSSMGSAPAGLVDRCVEIYRNHEPRIDLLEDSRDLLHACRTQLRTGLVTDGPRTSQRAKIHSLRLSEQIEKLVVTDEHEEGWRKPGHLPFQSLQRFFNVPGSECVYIGDNPSKDFVSPKAMGWHTVRVRRAGGLHEAVDSPEDAAVEIPDLTGPSVATVDCLSFLVGERTTFSK